jgi:hypothetical protein
MLNMLTNNVLLKDGAFTGLVGLCVLCFFSSPTTTANIVNMKELADNFAVIMSSISLMKKDFALEVIIRGEKEHSFVFCFDLLLQIRVLLWCSCT